MGPGLTVAQRHTGLSTLTEVAANVSPGIISDYPGDLGCPCVCTELRGTSTLQCLMQMAGLPSRRRRPSFVA
eukprot:15468792-Alexandrium_andersonii.AAC.1